MTKTMQTLTVLGLVLATAGCVHPPTGESLSESVPEATRQPRPSAQWLEAQAVLGAEISDALMEGQFERARHAQAWLRTRSYQH